MKTRDIVELIGLLIAAKLAGGCADPGFSHNPEKLFVIRKAIYRNEGQG
jgi:hypothetical protein